MLPSTFPSRTAALIDQNGRPQTAEEAHCDIEITTPATLMNRVDVDVVNEETEPKRERRARTVRAIEQSVRAIEQSMTNFGHPTP